jgi:lipopolysaccharide export LptBFGC system permease protein LptF
MIIGLADVMPPILVLLGMSAAFFALGAWRFRYD